MHFQDILWIVFVLLLKTETGVIREEIWGSLDLVPRAKTIFLHHFNPEAEQEIFKDKQKPQEKVQAIQM